MKMSAGGMSVHEMEKPGLTRPIFAARRSSLLKPGTARHFCTAVATSASSMTVRRGCSHCVGRELSSTKGRAPRERE